MKWLASSVQIYWKVNLHADLKSQIIKESMKHFRLWLSFGSQKRASDYLMLLEGIILNYSSCSYLFSISRDLIFVRLLKGNFLRTSIYAREMSENHYFSTTNLSHSKLCAYFTNWGTLWHFAAIPNEATTFLNLEPSQSLLFQTIKTSQYLLSTYFNFRRVESATNSP